MSRRVSGKGPSQRQLRVGELIRKALSDVFLRTEIQDPDLEGIFLFVTEVSVSPDIRNATVYVYAHQENNLDGITDALKRHAKFLRGELARKVSLKHMPTLTFELDTNWDDSEKIEKLLRSPKVAQDLS